ncbi:MAG: hypothetical protein JXA67_09945 [Micromonosporaceae bacterium]|nr:hypothetical protein [Micromonosporaceae bacterium]
MGTELRVTLPGSGGSADARRALAVLDRVLIVLGRLEDATLPQREGPSEPTRWAFTYLTLGSVQTVLAPSLPRRGATTASLDQLMATTVEGFAVAEEHDGIPHRWDQATATAAVDLAQLLGLLPADGVELAILRDRQPVREVTITRRAGEHLREGLSIRRVSIGAIIGRLDTISCHSGYTAGLWPVRGGRRVEVIFDKKHLEAVHQVWGHIVSVSGRIERDCEGRPLRIRLRHLERLPETAPPLAQLVGLDPNLTGGQDPDDYLEEIRGAS